MKKVIALLAVSAFALAIVACGKKAEESAETETPQTEETTPAIDTAATTQDTTDTAAAQ